MLAIRHLSKTYPNGTAALRDFSLEVSGGQAVAIVGGSGCGKSTLLRLIAGLEQPTEGSVQVGGEAIAEPHPAVGLVFQEPRLLPWLTVADNIALGLDDIAPAERVHRVQEALRSVGLASQGERWPRELSGGMAQRVALARALVARPSVLLLDEPFSALDALTRSGLQDHLVALWEETKPTLVLVTHDIEEALVVADRIIILRPRPGQIDAVIDARLPRPRDRDSAQFEDIKKDLRIALDHSFRHQVEAAE